MSYMLHDRDKDYELILYTKPILTAHINSWSDEAAKKMALLTIDEAYQLADHLNWHLNGEKYENDTGEKGEVFNGYQWVEYRSEEKRSRLIYQQQKFCWCHSCITFDLQTVRIGFWHTWQYFHEDDDEGMSYLPEALFYPE